MVDLLRNRYEIERSIDLYFQADRYTRSIAFSLFEAADYIVNGTEPSSELLKNHIMTFDSPTMAEHLDLVRRFERLEVQFESMKEGARRRLEPSAFIDHLNGKPRPSGLEVTHI
jgi:hypothetical protein